MSHYTIISNLGEEDQKIIADHDTLQESIDHISDLADNVIDEGLNTTGQWIVNDHLYRIEIMDNYNQLEPESVC